MQQITHSRSYSGRSFIDRELSERFPFHGEKKKRSARRGLASVWKRRRIGSPLNRKDTTISTEPRYIAAKLHRPRAWREHFSGTLSRNYMRFGIRGGMLAAIAILFFRVAIGFDVPQRHTRQILVDLLFKVNLFSVRQNWHETLTTSL